MDQFSKKLNDVSPRKITINEYLPNNDNPNEAFKKMIESGTKCDGLVISGHHTGSFGGARGGGSLNLDFMEKLRCDPKYQDFFENIQAVWLQGCRTLGVNVVTNELDEEQLEEDQYNADMQMFRVGDVLAEDHLEQGISDLGVEFSATLDQDNPLSSRYLKLFPRANVFGWTKTAPGVKSKSEYSIPYHIAHISKLLDDRKEYFENPIKEDLSDLTAARYAQILLDLLNTDSPERNPCRLTDGETAIEGWISHGSYSKHGLPLSFDNADLMAYSSLFKANNPLLTKSREIDCLFKQELKEKELSNLLDIVLSDERLLGYSFNSLHALMTKYVASSPEKLVLLQDKLKSSQVFMHFIQRKLSSKQNSLIKKVEYFDFLKIVTGDKYENLEKTIKNKALEHLNIKARGSNDYDLFDYKLTLLEALAGHNLLTTDFAKSSMDLKNLSLREKATLYSYIITEKSESKIPEVEEKLRKGLLKFAKNNTTEVDLNVQSEGQLARLNASLRSNKIVLSAFKNSSMLNTQFVEELVKTKPNVLFKMALAEHLPTTLEADERLSITRSLIGNEKNKRKRFNIAEALFESFEDTNKFNSELLNEYRQLAVDTDTEFYLNSALNDIMASLEEEDPKDLRSLLEVYAANRKGHNFFSRGHAINAVLTKIKDRNEQEKHIELLLEADETCDNKCLLKLTTGKKDGLKLLETSDKLAGHIMNSLQTWDKDKFLESITTNWKNNNISEKSVERLLTKIDFSDIQDRNHYKYMDLLGQIRSRPIDQELYDIVHSDSCGSRCKREALELLAESEYPSPLALAIISTIEESANDGYELREIMKSINKFKYQVPQIETVIDKIVIKAKSNDPNYASYKDDVFDSLKVNKELTYFERFLLYFQ